MRIVRLLPTIALADQRGGEFCARPLFKTPVLSATIASLQPQLAGAFSQSRNVSVIRSIYIGIYRVAITEILMKLLSSYFLSFSLPKF
jgi:hypothetical protein